MKYSLNWDLDSLFPGGINSEALQKRMAKLENELAEYQTFVEQWQPQDDLSHFNHLADIMKQQAKCADGLAQCNSFVTAIQSADMNNTKAKSISAILAKYETKYETILTTETKKLTALDDQQWQALKATELAQKHGVLFHLEEQRKDGKKLLSNQAETIISQLSIDGFAAWSDHYDTLVSMIHIPFTDEKGQTELLSAGQASNKMASDPDPQVRQQLFNEWEKAWAKMAPLFADTLNHLAGFRLTNQQLHGDENHLAEPLHYNRMSQQTLETMWQTITDNKSSLVKFLDRKAQLMNKKQLSWVDQEAPVIVGNLKESHFTFDQAAEFIIKQFGQFSPKMADFAKLAFEKQWIEAEDRPGKRPGGYCTSLPESCESRIFMTYGGSINEVATLAHELGHAFHSHVMWDLPNVSQEYAMNVAETASTFAELIVADATLKQAPTVEEKINLLDVKLQNTIAMFTNIHARFIFEDHYYTVRKKHLPSAKEISDMMLAAQKEAYHDSLTEYHPHFWSSKLHFYIDDVPFYNFPYTFGYLFSLGIYQQAQSGQSNFEQSYIDLLRDTASMSTEDLAKKHLNVDLTKPEFWQSAIDVMIKDIDLFMTLSDAYI